MTCTSIRKITFPKYEIVLSRDRWDQGTQEVRMWDEDVATAHAVPHVSHCKSFWELTQYHLRKVSSAMCHIYPSRIHWMNGLSPKWPSRSWIPSDLLQINISTFFLRKDSNKLWLIRAHLLYSSTRYSISICAICTALSASLIANSCYED